MKTVVKKFKTLIHLDWKWAKRYYSKKVKTYLLFYFSKLLGRKYLSGTVDGIEIKLGFLTPYHHLIAYGFSKGKQEPWMMLMWKKAAENKKVIYDIGGYNGIFGLVAAKANPSATVIIFEPSKINAEHITQNIKLNNLQNCSLRQIAVSDKKGIVSFSSKRTQGTADHITYKIKGEEINDDKVDSIDMDSLSTVPDLIKIDAEGAEFSILRGAEKTLSKKPLILLEVHPHYMEKYGVREEDLWSLLRNNYGWWFLDSTSDLTSHYLVYPRN